MGINRVLKALGWTYAVLIVGFLLLCAARSFSAPLNVPHTFIGETPAIGREVNENFDEVESIVNNIESDNIAAGAVGTDEIANGSIVNVDISNSAAISPSKINWPAPTPGAASVGNVKYLDGHTYEDILEAAEALLAGATAVTGGIVCAFDTNFQYRIGGDPVALPSGFWTVNTPGGTNFATIDVTFSSPVERYIVNTTWNGGRPCGGGVHVFNQTSSGFSLWCVFPNCCDETGLNNDRWFTRNDQSACTDSATLTVAVTNLTAAPTPTVDYDGS